VGGRAGAGSFLSATRRAWPWLRAAVPFVGLILGVSVLLLLIDVRGALAALVSADPLWLLACGGLAVNATLLVGAKLWAVVRIVGVPRTVAETWSAVMAGLTMNAILPGRGGDLVRAVFLAREPGTLTVLLGAVLVERLIDLGTLGVVVLLTGVALDATTGLAVAVIVAAVGGGAVLALLGPRSPIRPDLGERLARTARQVVQRPGWTAVATGLSLIAWANNAALMLAAMRAVDVSIPAWPALRGITVAILAGVVPVTVSGIGTRDAALVWLLRSYEQGEGLAAAGLLYTAFVYWFLALIGAAALGGETLRTVRTQVARWRDRKGEGPEVEEGA
jgi:uncharacterized membrane protein YbhN (UPF0104 family)